MIDPRDLGNEENDYNVHNYIFNITPMDIDDNIDFLVVNYGSADFLVSGNIAQKVIDRLKEFLILHEIDLPVLPIPFFMNVKGMKSSEKEKLLETLKSTVKLMEELDGKVYCEHCEEDDEHRGLSVDTCHCGKLICPSCQDGGYH